MDAANVPQRPPPPPPINSNPSYNAASDDEEENVPLHRAAGGGDYIDSPGGSPPSFADALRGASPTGLYWEGSGRQPIPQEDSDDDNSDSPPLYSSGSEAPPMAGLGERLGAFVGYRDHEPSPRDGESQRDENHQPHHQTPPPPFEEEEEEEEEDEEIPRQPSLIIITGATTGLGYALFTHFASKPKSAPDVPYDVIGIDKTPWRVPGTGFRWQTPVGKCGMFTQLDLTARPQRLESWAQTYLYSKPVRTRKRRGGKGGNVRYPRPVSLVVHCAANSARGLVEQQQPEETQSDGKKKKKKTVPVPVVVDEDELESFEAMDGPTMRSTFDMNVVGTLQLVQMFTPHLQLEASTRDEDLGVLIDAKESTSAASSSAGEPESDSEDEEQAPTAANPSNLDWLEALKKQGSRASLQITPPPPPKKKKEKVLPSAPRDGIPAPRVVIMAHCMGSISGNKNGGAYAYRASQAALNAVVRSLSIDVPEVCFACVYPGEVVDEKKLKVGPPTKPPTTPLTAGPLVKMDLEHGDGNDSKKENASKEKKKKKDKKMEKVSCEDSIKGLLPMFEKLGEGKLRTGCFVDRFGEPIPW